MDPSPEAMHPDAPADAVWTADLTMPLARRSHHGSTKEFSPERPASARDPMVARSSVGLASLPTIVALGPFDDSAHAEALAEAFVTVRRRCRAQLVLVGTGVQRAAVMRRTLARGVGANAHIVRDSSGDRWSNLVAAADVVVPSPGSGVGTLLDVMAAGRAVVAPTSPATARLVMPASAGLLYRPGDVPAMAGAMLRLITSPALRHGMEIRAVDVARRHHLRAVERHWSDEGNGDVPGRKPR